MGKAAWKRSSASPATMHQTEKVVSHVPIFPVYLGAQKTSEKDLLLIEVGQTSRFQICFKPVLAVFRNKASCWLDTDNIPRTLCVSRSRCCMKPACSIQHVALVHTLLPLPLAHISIWTLTQVSPGKRHSYQLSPQCVFGQRSSRLILLTDAAQKDSISVLPSEKWMKQQTRFESHCLFRRGGLQDFSRTKVWGGIPLFFHDFEKTILSWSPHPALATKTLVRIQTGSEPKNPALILHNLHCRVRSPHRSQDSLGLTTTHHPDPVPFTPVAEESLHEQSSSSGQLKHGLWKQRRRSKFHEVHISSQNPQLRGSAMGPEFNTDVFDMSIESDTAGWTSLFHWHKRWWHQWWIFYPSVLFMVTDWWTKLGGKSQSDITASYWITTNAYTAVSPQTYAWRTAVVFVWARERKREREREREEIERERCEETGIIYMHLGVSKNCSFEQSLNLK